MMLVSAQPSPVFAFLVIIFHPEYSSSPYFLSTFTPLRQDVVWCLLAVHLAFISIFFDPFILLLPLPFPLPLPPHSLTGSLVRSHPPITHDSRSPRPCITNTSLSLTMIADVHARTHMHADAHTHPGHVTRCTQEPYRCFRQTTARNNDVKKKEKIHILSFIPLIRVIYIPLIYRSLDKHTKYILNQRLNTYT